MRRTILIAVVLFAANLAFAQDFEKFNDFNTRVLTSKVSKTEAVAQFDTLVKAITHYDMLRNEVIPVRSSWVFPLQGYNYSAIGGSNGNGYSDKGYRYLDGNKHLAHPAHDIFIRDKNQDCIDDKTGKPVNVLAVDDGFVIACTNDWDPAGNLRGGKYIWIYHPYGLPGDKSPYRFGSITYYAHNRAIFVKPGDWVKEGQKIAEVGRTGFSAYKKRSPTHLHFSAFHIINGLPVPFNPYSELKKAVTQ
jgi:murein DD-endopeptidase MepM/ murein hydrolase activator NlpD